MSNDAERHELIAIARSHRGAIRLRGHGRAGDVGAALRTRDGRIYTGVCIDLPSGLGFCAEASAIAGMLGHRETEIEMIVAVSGDGILPPCGRCRELMAQVDESNLDAVVIVSEADDATLRELLPY